MSKSKLAIGIVLIVLVVLVGASNIKKRSAEIENNKVVDVERKPDVKKTNKKPGIPHSASIILDIDPFQGEYLVDETGRTVYSYVVDEPGESNCVEACTNNWFPLEPIGDVTLSDSLDGDLDVIERPDGLRQITYNDIPLYLYKGDGQPGDIGGNGINDEWFIVKP